MGDKMTLKVKSQKLSLLKQIADLLDSFFTKITNWVIYFLKLLLLIQCFVLLYIYFWILGVICCAEYFIGYVSIKDLTAAPTAKAAPAQTPPIIRDSSPEYNQKTGLKIDFADPASSKLTPEIPNAST